MAAKGLFIPPGRLAIPSSLLDHGSRQDCTGVVSGSRRFDTKNSGKLYRGRSFA